MFKLSSFTLPSICWDPLVPLCFVLACTETLPLLRTLPPSQLYLEFGFRSPAESCMSYLKPSFSRTFIHEMHHILLKHVPRVRNERMLLPCDWSPCSEPFACSHLLAVECLLRLRGQQNKPCLASLEPVVWQSRDSASNVAVTNSCNNTTFQDEQWPS